MSRSIARHPRQAEEAHGGRLEAGNRDHEDLDGPQSDEDVDGLREPRDVLRDVRRVRPDDDALRSLEPLGLRGHRVLGAQRADGRRSDGETRQALVHLDRGARAGSHRAAGVHGVSEEGIFAREHSLLGGRQRHATFSSQPDSEKIARNLRVSS